MKKSFLIVLCLVLMINSCSKQNSEEIAREITRKQTISRLPHGAKEIQYIGNNWVYFPIENKRFLGHLSYRNSCLTQIKE